MPPGRPAQPLTAASVFGCRHREARSADWWNAFHYRFEGYPGFSASPPPCFSFSCRRLQCLP